ncbi:MAG: hypothetical protein ANABAC_0489 [Anaerolineae bacterium]|nr:MAG: hypothetical protein ANABAC_0489 [Anaerolineae bacterium]
MQILSTKSLRILLIGILFVSSLACNLISGFLENLEGVKSTAVSIATEAKGGQEALATAQAIATQLADSHLMETAKAMATEVSQSGALETLQAVITEQAPGLEATLQAFLTQEAPALEETARAVLTQVPPISPLATPDIPMVEGEKENLVVSNNTITYVVSMPYSEVISFYKTEMPKKGWSYQAETSKELQNSSLLNYTKDNLTASISITFNPANQKTMVVILLQNP